MTGIKLRDQIKLVQVILYVIVVALPVSKAFAQETLVFTAPPRESAEKGQLTYAPIAEYLSQVLGRKVEYRQPDNWLSYSSDMRSEKYDIVFDGPHFVSWRIKTINHTPIVKIPGGFVFKLVSASDNTKVQEVSDLVGRRVCGHAPPNQGTLRLYNQFANPMRQPVLVVKKGWRNIFSAMMSGDCAAAIVPEKIYKKMDPKRTDGIVLFSSNPVSGQAITVSKKFSHQDIVKMRQALLSKEGQQATENLRKRFASPTLATANRLEYEGVSHLLDETYGFDEGI